MAPAKKSHTLGSQPTSPKVCGYSQYLTMANQCGAIAYRYVEWKTDLKINDLNFASILLAAKKEKHEALYHAAVTYIARGLKRLKTTDQFKKLQNDPDILISILEQAKSPRGKHSKYVYLS